MAVEQSQTLPAAGGAEFLFSACSLICSQLWEPCKHKKQRRIGGFNGSCGFEYSSLQFSQIVGKKDSISRMMRRASDALFE